MIANEMNKTTAVIEHYSVHELGKMVEICNSIHFSRMHRSTTNNVKIKTNGLALSVKI